MILTSETRAAFVAPRWLAQHIGTGGRLEGRASAASLQADCDRSITVIAPRIMVRHGRLRSRRTEACDPCSERPRQLKSFSGLVLPSQRRPIGLRLQICYSSVRFRPAPLDTGELVGWIANFVWNGLGKLLLPRPFAYRRLSFFVWTARLPPNEGEYVVLHAIRELAPDLKQVERFYVRRSLP